MIKIWSESAKFNASQRFTNQVNLILKRGCFSGFEILEIQEQVNREEYANHEFPK